MSRKGMRVRVSSTDPSGLRASSCKRPARSARDEGGRRGRRDALEGLEGRICRFPGRFKRLDLSPRPERSARSGSSDQPCSKADKQGSRHALPPIAIDRRRAQVMPEQLIRVVGDLLRPGIVGDQLVHDLRQALEPRTGGEDHVLGRGAGGGVEEMVKVLRSRKSQRR